MPSVPFVPEAIDYDPLETQSSAQQDSQQKFSPQELASVAAFLASDAIGLPQPGSGSGCGNHTSACEPLQNLVLTSRSDAASGIDDIRQQIANQADSVRRSFESSLKRNTASPATIAAALHMASKNKKRKIEDFPVAPHVQSSETWRKTRHFHSPIASLTRPDKRDETNYISNKNYTSVAQNLGVITLNSPPNEIHLSYNDVVCGRGKMMNNLVGNQRYRVWVDLHRQSFAKAPFEEDKKRIACSIVNTIRGSVPSGRFISLDTSTGAWYDVGHEAALRATMEALSEGISKPSPSVVFPPNMAPSRVVRKTLASKAA